MEWVSRAWADAGQPHWVEEDIGQVVEGACMLAVLRYELHCQSLLSKGYQSTYVASDPYLGKQTLLQITAQLICKLERNGNSRWPLGGGILGG
jgi:hypothetical protein